MPGAGIYYYAPGGRITLLPVPDNITPRGKTHFGKKFCVYVSVIAEFEAQ